MAQDEWYASPTAFCRDVFSPDEQPTEAQAEVLASLAMNKCVVAKTHRAWGATRLCAYAAWWWFITRGNGLVRSTSDSAQWIESEARHLWVVSALLQNAYFAGVPPIKIFNKTVAAEAPVLLLSDLPFRVPDDFGQPDKGPTPAILAVGRTGRAKGWFYEAFKARRRDGYATFTFSGHDSSVPEIRAQAEKVAQLLAESDPFLRQQWLAEFTEDEP